MPDKPIYKARVFLTDKQPKYPGPFVMYNGVSSLVRMNTWTLRTNEISTYSSLSANGKDSKLIAAWNGDADINKFKADGVD